MKNNRLQLIVTKLKLNKEQLFIGMNIDKLTRDLLNK